MGGVHTAPSSCQHKRVVFSRQRLHIPFPPAGTAVVGLQRKQKKKEERRREKKERKKERKRERERERERERKRGGRENNSNTKRIRHTKKIFEAMSCCGSSKIQRASEEKTGW